MNTPNRLHSGRRLLSLSAALALIPLAPAATWIGDTDTNLATGANWDALPASGDAWVFGAPGTAGATLTNTLTSPAFVVSGITFNSATAYTLGGNAFTLSGIIANNTAGTHTISSAISVSGTSGVTAVSGAHLVLSGNLTGSGSFAQNTATWNPGGTSTLTLSGDNSGFTGSFTASNSNAIRTSFNAATAGSASASWEFNRAINGGVALNFTNATIDFGALSGGGYIRANNVGTVTVRVGALNADTTFSGILQQGNATQILALTKVGTGTLTLGGANTYVGATRVEAGTLALGVNGTLGSSTVYQILAGATLDTSAKATYDLAGRAITLGVSNTAHGLFEAAALTFGGTLNLEFTGALTGNISYTLFDADTYAGNFGSVSLTGSVIGTLAAESATLWTGTIDGYDFSFDAGTGILTAFAIPEPSAFATLAGLGVLGLAALRRRRA